MNQLVQEEVRGGRIESDENCWQWGPGPFFFLSDIIKIIHRAKAQLNISFAFERSRLRPRSSPSAPPDPPPPPAHIPTHAKDRRNKQNKRADLIIRSPPNQKLWQVRISRSRSDAGRNGPMLTSAGEKPESPSSGYW